MKKFFSNNYVILFEIVIILGALYWYFYDAGSTESILVGVSAFSTLIGSIFSKLSKDKNQSTATVQNTHKKSISKEKSKMKIINNGKIDRQINIKENSGNITL